MDRNEEFYDGLKFSDLNNWLKGNSIYQDRQHKKKVDLTLGKIIKMSSRNRH